MMQNFNKLQPGTKPYMVQGKPSKEYVVLANGDISFVCNAITNSPVSSFDPLAYWGIAEEKRKEISPSGYMHLLIAAAKEKDYQNGMNIEAALTAPTPSAKERLPSKELVKAHVGLIDF